MRDQLLGEIALARGDRRSAEDHFIAADDVFAIDALLQRAQDPTSAYAIELRVIKRLQLGATHPDALADAYWRSGKLAATIGYAHPRVRAMWFERAMRAYQQAVALSPLSQTYLIAAGVEAINLQTPQDALRYFRRAADIDPASADAYAGLGMAALHMGDRAAALSYAAQSRAHDPHSHFLRSLEAELRKH